MSTTSPPVGCPGRNMHNNDNTDGKFSAAHLGNTCYLELQIPRESTANEWQSYIRARSNTQMLEILAYNYPCTGHPPPHNFSHVRRESGFLCAGGNA